MYSFGPLYVTWFKYPVECGALPFFETGWTQETEERYRKGKCLVIRPPFSRLGVGFGVWVDKNVDKEAALWEAMGARKMDLKEFNSVFEAQQDQVG